jgi:2-oxoglutarate ferredoxin oxidoreductase subunit delta
MQVHGRTPLNIQQATTPHGAVNIILERCKGCEFCVRLCPQDVLFISKKTNSKGYHFPDIAVGKAEACIHCEFCTLVCPEFAIFTTALEAAS